MSKPVARVILTLYVSLVLSACVSMQKQVESEGWIPLRTFDFIQLSAGNAAGQALSVNNSDFIGSISPLAPLGEYGFWWWDKTHVISNMASPLMRKYSYSIKYSKGPDSILKSQNYSVKIANVSINSWLKLGLTGTLKSDLELKNVVHASIKLEDDDFVGFLQSFDSAEPSRSFWITDVLAADVKNIQTAGLSLADTTIDMGKFKADLNIGIGDEKKEKVTLEGPCLLFGVRGYVVDAEKTGKLDKFALPEAGSTAEYALPLKQTSLLVTRTGRSSVTFKIRGASAAKVYRLDFAETKWKADTSRNDGSVSVAWEAPPQRDDQYGSALLAMARRDDGVAAEKAAPLMKKERPSVPASSGPGGPAEENALKKDGMRKKEAKADAKEEGPGSRKFKASASYEAADGPVPHAVPRSRFAALEERMAPPRLYALNINSGQGGTTDVRIVIPSPDNKVIDVIVLYIINGEKGADCFADIYHVETKQVDTVSRYAAAQQHP